MDFKGYFTTGDCKRCDPFIITDAHSRYLIRCLDRLAHGPQPGSGDLRSGHARVRVTRHSKAYERHNAYIADKSCTDAFSASRCVGFYYPSCFGTVKLRSGTE